MHNQKSLGEILIVYRSNRACIVGTVEALDGRRIPPPTRLFCYVSEHFVAVNGMIWLQFLGSEVSMGFIVQSSW